MQEGRLDIVALTYDDKILSYVNNTYQEYEAPDIVDIEMRLDYEGYEIYKLQDDGNLYVHENNNYIFSDVIYIENGILVTRSGNIYRITGDRVESTEGKTMVLNEWLERMN